MTRFSLESSARTSSDGDAMVELLWSDLWDRGTTGVFEGEDGSSIAGFEREDEARRAAAWLVEQPVVNGSSVAVEPAADAGTWAATETTAVLIPTAEPIALSIVAGASFGHGGHPTTAVALDQLAAALRPGMAVLDLGTGSGVLAIAAASLGAATVDAVDIDPAAVDIAERNAAANGVRIDASTETVDQVRARRGQGFDLIAMNVLLPVHRELAMAVAAALAPHGLLITAGYLVDQADEVEQLYRHATPSLTPSARQTIDGWVGHRFSETDGAR